MKLSLGSLSKKLGEKYIIKAIKIFYENSF